MFLDPRSKCCLVYLVKNNLLRFRLSEPKSKKITHGPTVNSCGLYTVHVQNYLGPVHDKLLLSQRFFYFSCKKRNLPQIIWDLDRVQFGNCLLSKMNFLTWTRVFVKKYKQYVKFLFKYLNKRFYPVH